MTTLAELKPLAGSMARVIDGALPAGAVAYLNGLAEASAAEARAGTIDNVAATGGPLEAIRRSEVFFLRQDDETRPVIEAIAGVVRRVNAEVYGYELEKIEPFQLATYRAENDGFYGWHVDVGPGALSQRKLSLVVALTEPSDYEGGELQAFCDREPVTIPMPQGRIVAFPSFMLHRVTPVTQGLRRSVAVWAVGKPFR